MRVSDWSSYVCSSDLLAYQQMQVQTARDNYEVALTMQKILHANDAVMSAHLLLGIAGCEMRLDHAAAAERLARHDRKSVGTGKSVSVRVVLGGTRYV